MTLTAGGLPAGRPPASFLSNSYFSTFVDQGINIMRSASVSFGINRRIVLIIAATVAILFGPTLPILGQAQAQTDPLPSWNEGATKRAITDFVARVTRQGGPDFVPPASASRRSTTTGRCGSSIRCMCNWPSRSIA